MLKRGKRIFLSVILLANILSAPLYSKDFERTNSTREQASKIERMVNMATPNISKQNAAKRYYASNAGNLALALSMARNGDVVYASPGNYKLSNQLVIYPGVNLIAPGGPNTTVLDGDNKTRCIYNWQGNIMGFTIKNGYNWYPKDGLGGGIMSVNGKIENCVLLNNRSFRSGGGIFDGGGSKIDRCRIVGNYARLGAGVHLSAGGLISNSLISKNHAVTNEHSGPGIAQGGGIYLYEINHKVLGCTIVENFAEEGGGIYNLVGSGRIWNSIIFYNRAHYNKNYFLTQESNISMEYVCTYPAIKNATAIGPGFRDIQNSDYHLIQNSQCRNATPNALIDQGYKLKDLENRTRPLENSFDMGCYELDPANLVGDLVPDWWKTEYGLDINRAVALEDPDGDGFNNLAEYIAGTNPLDKDSYLKFDNIYFSSNSSINLEFFSKVGREYNIYYSDKMQADSTWYFLQQNIPGINDTLIVEDPSTENLKFYRLDVTLP